LYTWTSRQMLVKLNFQNPQLPTHFSMNVTNIVKAYEELTLNELYALLKLRSEVFVVEQNCLFLDQDDKDQKCHHQLVFADNILVGYSRLVPAGLSYPEISIGRVVTSPAFRGKGLGKLVMELSIQNCLKIFGVSDIRLGAQTYALGFYSALGFVSDGNTYDEDGIEHIEMLWKN